MKKFTKILKNQKGLTLIELLAVIVILAIVAAIAVPAIGNVIDNSKDKAILADASSILSGAKLAATSGDCTVASNITTCDATVLESYVEGPALTDVSAVKEGKSWSITYPEFAKVKNSKYKTGLGASDTTLTEKELNTSLGN